MKKRLLILLLAMLLLTGCGRQKNVQAAICLRQCADSAAAENLDAMRTALTAAGYTVAAADAEEDQARQLRQIRDLLEEGYGLLVVEPVMMEQAQTIADMAREAKVPVIFIGYAPEQTVLESWEKSCYIGCREAEAGGVQPQVLQGLPDGGDLNGDGVLAYAVIAGPEDDMDALARTDACVRAVENGLCLETVCTDWSREAAQSACAKLLSAYGKDMEAVFCNSDTLALGAADAITEGGRVVNETIYLVGLDGDFQTRLLIRSGDLTGTVYLPAAEQARKVAEAAAALLSGQGTENYYGTYIPLTRDNVEDYIPK